MKKLTFILFLIVLPFWLKAQSLAGIWKTSVGGKIQIEDSENGFTYKNLSDSTILQTYYTGESYDIPTYRLDMQDGSYILFMTLGNKITLSYSLNPSNVITWTKISNEQSSSNCDKQQSQNQNLAYQQNNRTATQCTSCKGEGQIACSTCNGKGSSQKSYSTPTNGTSNYKIVKKSDGTYEEVYESLDQLVDEPCSACGGTGTQTCKACNGMGER